MTYVAFKNFLELAAFRQTFKVNTFPVTSLIQTNTLKLNNKKYVWKQKE